MSPRAQSPGSNLSCLESSILEKQVFSPALSNKSRITGRGSGGDTHCPQLLIFSILILFLAAPWVKASCLCVLPA